MNILCSVKQQLACAGLTNTPLLVACSAGPDSVALLLALHALKHPVEVVHVNHQTRIECEQEALFVQKLCEKLNLPLHTYCLPKKLPKQNKEEYWRNQRLTYFEKICEKRNISCVALGHHAGDNQETVCKRFFEGTSLLHLQGMTPFSKQGCIFYFRPFLSIEKKELLSFLQKLGQSFCFDASNSDLQFTRNRIRALLDEKNNSLVKKNMRKGVQQVINETSKLSDYLERRIARHSFESKSFPLGGALYFHSDEMDIYEVEVILRRFLQTHFATFSRKQVDCAVRAVAAREADKQFLAANAQLIVDRGKVFLFSPSIDCYTFVLSGLGNGARCERQACKKTGLNSFVLSSKLQQTQSPSLTLPEKLLSGTFSFATSVPVTHLGVLTGLFTVGNKQGSKARAACRYPAIFRRLPLGVYGGKEVAADLFSGLGCVQDGHWYQVELERQSPSVIK